MSAAEFQQFLGHLEASVRGHRGAGVDLKVGSDFNARPVSWGDRLTESHGDDLAALVGSLRLVVLNSGWEVGTDLLWKGKRSCVDVTFASESGARKIWGWIVRTDVENM